MTDIKVEEYRINSIFILQCENSNNKIVRGTCFSISNKFILTAKHNLLDDCKTIKIFTSSDDFSRSNFIEAELIYFNEEIDIAILSVKDFIFSDFIELNVASVNMETQVLSCGYPVEKKHYDAPIKLKVTNNFENIEDREYSFEVSQDNTVSAYKGMSGAPIIYNKKCIGVMIVQQAQNTLYAMSIKDIITDENFLNTLTESGIVIDEIEGFDYQPPPYPPISPFKYCINCNDGEPNIKGVDIGFELKKWKLQNFVEVLHDWVIDYSLSLKDQKEFRGGHNQLFKRARSQYTIDNKDALADLCLHVAIRETYKTIPIMNKLFDLNNKTFSCTHAVLNMDKLELWIGASSVSNNIEDAVDNSIKNIKYILDNKSLHNRFFALTNQIDDSWPHKDKLVRLGDSKLSLEERFDKIIIPVFLMHDSDLIKNYNKDNFLKLFNAHIKNSRSLIESKFDSDVVDLIDLRVFCFPVSDIEKLNEAFVEEIS